jgi:vancomycin resistance protein YoaR
MRTFFISPAVIFILFMSALDSTALQAEEHAISFQETELKSYALTDWYDGFINWGKLDILLQQAEDQIFRPSVNATLDKDFTVIEAKNGAALDRTTFIASFLEAFYRGKDTSVPIPKKPVHPRVDGEMLREITQNQLGTYTTNYNPANRERSNNIHLSAEAIHGTVIFPGEEFSFNETVGERTEERGYQRAPVIVKGEFAEDIGGGICQVSSTLFNAADLRGIQMIERFTHSRAVPYVPPGRDATVSWWGPDFSFKNLYNEPVVITAKASNGSLTISIYSSETVEYFKGD